MAIQITKKKDFFIPDPRITAVRLAATNFLIPEIPVEVPVSVSYLGTAVIDNLEFPAGQYDDLEGNTIDYPSIRIDTVIIEVNKPRNIIKTAIQGRNGTVKEYISDGDYQINARGMISNPFNSFPLADTRDLRTILEVPQQLPVISLFLNDVFEVFEIVIEKYFIPQIEGKRNEVPFTFSASSDVPLDLEELG